jgi:hypothetical protein
MDVKGNNVGCGDGVRSRIAMLNWIKCTDHECRHYKFTSFLKNPM